MRKQFLLLVALLSLCHASFAQSLDERKDRIMASYLVAFGILPEQGEVNYWVTDPLSLKTVTDLVNKHKENIGSNQSLQDRAIRNSYQDALGRAPNADEYRTWRPLKLTYTELMSRHMEFLKNYPSAFEEVIRLTYKNEFNRNASAQEVTNWKSWGVRSYLAIAREHQKNKKAGMFASGSNTSSKIISNKQSGVQLQLSGKVSDELNRIASAGVISTGGGNVISTGGGNVISTGGGN
jgi:hypothetical protein